jgi:hypothetical protein
MGWKTDQVMHTHALFRHTQEKKVHLCRVTVVIDLCVEILSLDQWSEWDMGYLCYNQRH